LPVDKGGQVTLLSKIRGDGSPLPAQPTGRSIAFAWLGGFLAIATIALLTDHLAIALVLGSFGASCVLVFGFPDLPFAQPRNVIVGHLLSSLVGLAFLYGFGPHWWSVAAAVGTAIAVMKSRGLRWCATGGFDRRQAGPTPRAGPRCLARQT
jgi:CBS-domain-containing membrane protein